MNEFVGAAIGAALIHPNIAALSSAETLFTAFEGTIFQTNVTTTFLGIPVLMMSYSSTVVPAILATWVGSKVEKFFKKVTPAVIKMFFVPAMTLLIMVPLTLLAVGPVATWISDIVGNVFMTAHDFSPVLTGALVGGLWQVLVMFGLHWALVPLAITDVATSGSTFLLTGMLATTFTQTGTVAAIWFKTKSSKLKSLCPPACISAFAGVTEPAIYGITLPKKTPFIVSCIISAVAGGVLGAFHVMQYVIGGLGVFSWPAFVNTTTNDASGMVVAIIVSLAAMVAAFLVTLFTYRDEPAQKA